MATQPIGLPESIAFGEGFDFDLRPRRLRRGTRVLKLERIPLEILLLLLEHPGEIVRREDIAARVWGHDVFLDTDNSIRGAIRKIRAVLKDDPEQPRFIQTVTGQGYRFIAPVAVRPQAAPAAAPEPPIPLSSPAEIAPPEPATVAPPAPAASAPPRRRLLPALAAALALAIVLLVFVLPARRHPAPAPLTIRSLAVLPLNNLSSDPTQDYLADEMTEELIGRLAAIHNLRVISRTSVTQFKAQRPTVPEIARRLSVDAVVEGSIIREGNRVRVHAQLIRAANDEHLWSETYDRELGDVLALESDVAQAIASKVEVTLSGQEHERLAATHKLSPEAYESYLKGVYTNRNTRAGMEQSIAFFEDAIRKDSTFAPAYLGLASAYSSLSTVYAGAPPRESRLKLVAAAQKALELDPRLAGAHVLLAEASQRQFLWDQTGAEYQRALDLEPNNVEANRGMASYLICRGNTSEGLIRAQHAGELDPLNVNGLVGDGFLFFLARRYDDSLQILNEALAVKPDDAVAHWFLGYNLIAKGQPQQAIPELERAVILSDRSPAVLGVLIRAYAHAGRRADALRILDELKRRSRTGYIPAGAFINAYLGLGDTEQAFVWLERGYEEKSGIMPLLKVHPHFDPIRNDPRFASLLHRVGLDQPAPMP
ncbi:tetratricopeptide repeat protein [Acidobacteria bacterium AB60]|nr:tetratricopeptide repeat protein [Acidobacteria bacterium AB60]